MLWESTQPFGDQAEILALSKAMKKYRYQMLRVYGVDPSKHERALNETGEDGWELVSVLSRKDDVGDEYVIYYLRRENTVSQ